MALTKGLTRYQRTTYCHALITLIGASSYFFFVAIVVLVVVFVATVVLVVFGAVVVFVATVVLVVFGAVVVFVATVVLVVFGAVVVFVATVVTVDFDAPDTGAAPTWEIPTKEAAKAIPTVAIVFFIMLPFVKQDHLVSFQWQS